MDREQNKTDPAGLADIWRNAEQRRAEDVGAWLSTFFEERRRLKASDTENPYPKGDPIFR